MKRFILSFSILIACNGIIAQTIPVTFRVNMGVQIYEGNFNPAIDTVVVRGSFQMDAGDPLGNWIGNYFAMNDVNGDSIYEVIANIPSALVGTYYEFKFVISPDGWEV